MDVMIVIVGFLKIRKREIMKKGVLLFVLVVFFVGMGFAKTPEIVNPPGPHAKFKWLLVVGHTLYPGHTHYLYADKYLILKEPGGWIWLLPEGNFETFSADNGEMPMPDIIAPGVFGAIILGYPEILRHTIFLKSRAPKPLAISKKFGFNSYDAMRFWIKNAKKIKLKARKAKVIFRQ